MEEKRITLPILVNKFDIYSAIHGVGIGINRIFVPHFIVDWKLRFKDKKSMKFRAEIDVMPLDALLDPQGKAVTGSMKTVGLEMIDGVRIGKHIRLFVEADSKEVADQKVEEACKKLLANQIMESFTYTLTEA